MSTRTTAADPTVLAPPADEPEQPGLGSRVLGWFAPIRPDARVAWLRTAVYFFVVVDIHLLVRDPIPLSRTRSSTSRCCSPGCSTCRHRVSR